MDECWVVIAAKVADSSSAVFGPFVSRDAASYWADANLMMPEGLEVAWEVHSVVSPSEWETV